MFNAVRLVKALEVCDGGSLWPERVMWMQWESVFVDDMDMAIPSAGWQKAVVTIGFDNWLDRIAAFCMRVTVF